MSEELPGPAPDPHPDEPTAIAGEGATGGSTWRMEAPASPGPSRTHGAPPPAELIGDFEVLGKLGQGGMGAVYRARQVSLDRQVALKILPASFESDAEFVTRFQREARIAASLSHANLVKVYSSGLADGCHYIAMELIEGETLGEWLKRGPLTPLEALRVTLDVARALECGWQRAQLIHRDIKPGNIFISESGDVKLGDLGLAKSIASDTTGLTQTGTAMGTPHYISPEQAKGDKDLDFRADIYSLGCTLYQMLTGRTPYEGRDPLTVMNMHINAPPPAILKVLPQCPIPLARLVAKMLKKVKRERHASYQELITDLQRAHAIFAPAASPLETTLPPDPDATILQAPPASPRTEGAKVPPPKPKTAFHGGIAAGVVVLGVVGYLVWPKAEKLTKAQIYARDHAGEKAVAEEQAPPSANADATPSKGNAGPPGVAPTAVPGNLPSSPATSDGWQNALLDPSKLSLGSGAKVTPGGLQFSGQAAARLVAGPQKDGAIRMRAVYDPQKKTLQLRARENAARECYQVLIEDGRRAELQQMVHAADNTAHPVLIRSFPLPEPLQAGQAYDLELRTVGHTVSVKFNGQSLGEASDEALTMGQFGIGSVDNVPALVKAFDYLDLEGRAGVSGAAAPANPANPASEAPFVNTVGMKFEPVPITGGPTDGKRVLFSIWETRVQDYEAFVKETKCEWPKPTFDQGPTHPAVNVSWDDATAFCQWLTERERKLGKVGADELYRLPTDHEWSCAVGIGQREDPAQSSGAKSGKLPNEFPWGMSWPPVSKVGNYNGQESVGASGPARDGTVDGYRDDFVWTAPVGSFPANARGLFDLGGNAWEWCDEGKLASDGRSVVRGGSYIYGQRNSLASSARFRIERAHRSSQNGFRIVLAADATVASPNGAGKRVNLIPLIDLKRDALKGTWSMKPDGLALETSADYNVLEVPYQPPEEYDFEIEFTPTENGYNVNQYLTAAGHNFAWKLNAHGRTPPLYGFELIDGKHMTELREAAKDNDLRLTVGTRIKSRVEVRRGSLRAWVNDQEFVAWSGDLGRLSIEAGTALRDPGHLGIGSYKRSVIFHRIEVREVTGTGR